MSIQVPGPDWPGPFSLPGGGRCAAPEDGRADAGHGDRRAPVGRRGQGQDDRLPGRADRDGRPLPGRRQRRPHASSAATRSSSSTSSRRASSTRTSRRSSATGVVVNPATLIDELDMLDRARHRRRRASGSARSAHVIMPYHVALDVANEARLGGGEGRDDRPRDRADLRRPGLARSGLRMEDLLDARRPATNARARPARQEPAPRGDRAARPFEVEPLVEQALAWGERLRDAPRRHDVARPGRARARRARAARGRPGHAPRPRPRLVPVRDLVEPGRRRRVHRRRHRAAPGRRGHRGHEGLLDAGRVRAVPDRAPRRDRAPGSRSAATSSGRRPAGRAGSAGSTPSRCATRWRSTASARIMLNKLDILSGVDPIRLCVAYELDGRRVETWPSSGAALDAGDADLRGLPGLGGADPRRPLAGRPARERAALRDSASRSTPACRSSSCRSGRSGRRRSSGPGGRCATGRGSAGMSAARDADPDPHRRRRRARARARLEAGAEPGVNEVIVAPGQRRDRAPSRGSAALPGVDPLDPAAVVAARPARGARSSSSIGPEAPLAAGVADALDGGGHRGLRAVGGGRPDRDRARRSATRSRRAAGVPMARAAAFDRRARGARVRRGRSRRRAAASWSRPTGWRPARASTVCDDAATRRSRPSTRARADAPTAAVVVEERLVGPRGEPHRALRRPRTRWPCRSPATTSGSATATRARTPAAWAPTARCPTCPTTAVDDLLARVPPADPGRAGPARHAVPRRALRRADADRRRPASCSSATPASATRRRRPSCRAWPSPLGPLLLAAARGASPAPARPGLAGVLPTLPGAAVGDRPGRRRLSRRRRDAATAIDGPRRGRSRRRARLPRRHAGATDDGTWRTAGGRVLTVVGRGPDLEAARAAAERRRRPDRLRRACSAATTSGARPRRPPRRGAGR